MKDGKFEPFEKVLMRDNEEAEWRAVFFSRYEQRSMKVYYITTGDVSYNQCIPYEGNEHLVGTTLSPQEPEHFEFGDHVIVREQEHCDWVHGIYNRPNCDGTHEVFLKGHDTSLSYIQCRKADW